MPAHATTCSHASAKLAGGMRWLDYLFIMTKLLCCYTFEA